MLVLYIYLHNCQAFSQSAGNGVRARGQCVSVPVRPHLCQHLVESFFTLAAQVGMCWHLSAGLLCVSLLAKEAELLPMC